MGTGDWGQSSKMGTPTQRKPQTPKGLEGLREKASHVPILKRLDAHPYVLDMLDSARMPGLKGWLRTRERTLNVRSMS